MTYPIQVQNLTKKFDQFTAVDNITFKVKEGEIFGFLGANGAGKTTAMRMLCGLSLPTSGEAEIAGFDLNKYPEKIKKNIGYMSQKFSLYEDLTVRENIRFYGGIYGLDNEKIKSKTNTMLSTLSLLEEKNTLVKSLPLGWRQKIAFSVAMVHDPKIIFLDEPTGGVDPIARREFWNMIYEVANNGTTVFVTTHYMDEAEYCSRVCIMVDGRIDALDTPLSLKKQFNSKDMNEVFVKLARHSKRTE